MGNIVWLASYPKSGNTWVRSFLYNLIKRPAQPGKINDLWSMFQDESQPKWFYPYLEGKSIEELPIEKISPLRWQIQRDIAESEDGSVFVKTHNMMAEHNGYPLINLSVTAGAIYIVRNPLDMVISLADHFDLSIDEAIDFISNDFTGSMTDEMTVARVIGSWSNHVKGWTQTAHDRYLVLRYEDLLTHPDKSFASIMKFLGMKKDMKELKRARLFSSFQELQKQEQKNEFNEKSPKSQRFFRIGKKDQWKKLLTPSQIQKIIDTQGEQMERFKYIPKSF
ncbi:MAG: sulfotransferase [Gammaproteobacteria bacterium CG22_combo_CG10-13_8_21_14_all_40_8]|nr:MAG: sulfotransferase [Gammaproteobacteria bacterium CG22_combo_CG10-13_8_21_14_all_40_8]